MKTVLPFVHQFFLNNGFLNKNNIKVIAAENYPSYPSMSSYFYRSISPVSPPVKGNNSFFNEITSALKIKKGNTEKETLINFLNAGYRLIDCYDHKMNPYSAKDIVNDLTLLGTSQIIFLDNDNIKTINNIALYVNNTSNNNFLQKIVPDYYRGKMVFPFPSYGNKKRFFDSITYARANKFFL